MSKLSIFKKSLLYFLPRENARQDDCTSWHKRKLSSLPSYLSSSSFIYHSSLLERKLNLTRDVSCDLRENKETPTSLSTGNCSHVYIFNSLPVSCFQGRAASARSVPASRELRVKCTPAKSWKRSGSKNARASRWSSARSSSCRKSTRCSLSTWPTPSRPRMPYAW